MLSNKDPILEKRIDLSLDEIWKHFTKSQLQAPNFKWFDKLTTLSQVEGQITMTQIQNAKRYGNSRVDGLVKNPKPTWTAIPSRIGVRDDGHAGKQLFQIVMDFGYRI